MKPIALITSAALAMTAAPQTAWAFDLGDIGSACLETRLQNCRVATAGFLNADDRDSEGTPFIAWQTQRGFTYEDGVMGGFVLFFHDGNGWSLLDARFEGWYAMPQLAGSELLHVPGYTGGTGAYNVDRLYQWEESSEGWRAIETDRWLHTIDDLLPEGLEIWKGVDYDFRNPWAGLFARTPLWRGSDANCCPTGGDAVITLEIEEGGLVALEVRHIPPPEADAP